MSLPEISVRRPVTVSMFFLGVVLLGLISWLRLPQELFPALSYPILSIVTTYENAAPEEVETLITRIIEESVGTVPKLKQISSTSKEGTSLVVAEFAWGTNMDFAALAVREKLDLIKERLPLESNEPIVMKFNPFELPILILSVTGDRHPADLREFAKKFIEDELEKVEGVASVSLSGGLEREILVELDKGKMYSHNATITNVVKVLKATNLNYPAGTLQEDFYEYLVRTLGEFQVVSDIGEAVVRVEEVDEVGRTVDEQRRLIREQLGDDSPLVRQRFVTVTDLGVLRDTFKEQTSVSRFNGKDNISLSVLKQADANTLNTAKLVKQELERIREDLPDGIDMEVVYDQSKFIQRSINEVRDAALLGGVLVFFVLLFFLRSLRSSLIVVTAIPVSVMTAFSLMYFSGISINIMSLMGLALGVGLLVDNAIVVIENITRLRIEGRSIREAAREGATQMNNALTSSTLTTVCVFLPMVFVVGIAGQLFKELASTVTFSLLASLLVALSLIPRLVAGRREILLPAAVAVDSYNPMEGLEARYAAVVPWSIRNRNRVFSVVLLAVAVSMLLFLGIDRRFMPKVDEGQFVIEVTLPTGTPLEITDQVVTELEAGLATLPIIRSIALTVGSNRDRSSGEELETLGPHQARLIIDLHDKRRVSTTDVVSDVKAQFIGSSLRGARLEYIVQESLFSTAVQGSQPVVIELEGNDLTELTQLTRRMERRLSTVPGIVGVRTSLTLPHPEIKVQINKDRASLYHLTVNDIAVSAHTAVKGVVATKFKEEGSEIDVRVRLRPEDRRNLLQLRHLMLTSPNDATVPLGEVAYLTRGVGPSEIQRLGQQRVTFVTAGIQGRGQNDVMAEVEQLIRDFEQETGIDQVEEKAVTLTGERAQMQESFASLRFALLLSVLLVYMIMAAQFESLWQPFVILFTVPLSITGVALILFVTRTPLSVVVLLGVIVLGGIVVNNGIVLIDTINFLRTTGMALEAAVEQAARSRLRPILMTTLTTVLGWAPMAVSGSMMSPLAITVMGGLTVSTFLTLVVIPLGYYVVARNRPLHIVEVPETPDSLSVSDEALVETAQPRVASDDELQVTEIPSVPHARSVMPPMAQWPTPVHEEATQLVSVEPQMPVSEPPTTEPSPLNRRQQNVLHHLQSHYRITRKDYAVRYGVSVPTAARDLKELLDLGWVRAKGPLGPGRWYELDPSAPPIPPAQPADIDVPLAEERSSVADQGSEKTLPAPEPMPSPKPTSKETELLEPDVPVDGPEGPRPHRESANDLRLLGVISTFDHTIEEQTPQPDTEQDAAEDQPTPDESAGDSPSSLESPISGDEVQADESADPPRDEKRQSHEGESGDSDASTESPHE